MSAARTTASVAHQPPGPSKANLRLIAVPALESLTSNDYRVVAVYTQPDRPAGRGRKLQQSPVKRCALEHGLAVLQPASFKSQDDLRRLRRFDADIMIVAAYGLLLPPAVLAAPDETKASVVLGAGSCLSRVRFHPTAPRSPIVQEIPQNYPRSMPLPLPKVGSP